MIDRSAPSRRTAALPSGHDVVLVGHLVLDPAVEVLVLEVEDRIVVADRRLQQSFRVVGGRRLDHLQARRVEEERLRVERVERPAADAAAGRTADDDWHAGAVAIPARRGEVRQHVEAARDEIDELDFTDRPHAHVRRADRGADDRRFRDRRVDDARLAELSCSPSVTLKAPP